jgi:filamentous hemagglutinin family protein
MAIRQCLSCLLLFLVSNVLFAGVAKTVSAAIVRDGTVGPTAATQPVGVIDSTSGVTNYEIPATHGAQAGTNLFHSFSSFNISNIESATFTPSGATGAINNIITRVTGGSLSTIDGLLSSSQITGANFFLLNPNGVLFGPGARLDVGGSFHVSTADYIGFANQDKFYANPSVSSVLSLADPVSFGFLGSNPGGGIRIEQNADSSGLSVLDSKTLSIIGGEIVVVGDPNSVNYALATSGTGGRINLISVTSPGEVNLSLSDLGTSSFSSFGNISFSNSAYIFAGGADPTTDSGGTLFVRGNQMSFSNLGIITDGYAPGQVDVKGGSFSLIDGASISAWNYGDSAQKASVKADLSGDFIMSNASSIDTSNMSSGRAGDVDIHAANVNISGGSGVFSHSKDSGRAGDITINSPTISLSELSYLQSNAVLSGNAGDITLNATDLTMSLGGQITSQALVGSSGNAGNISINANNIMIGDDTPGIGPGAADGNYGFIISNTDSTGLGGNVSIHATGAVTVQNGFSVAVSSTTNATGDAGNLTITADTLKCIDKGSIATTSYNTGKNGIVSVTAKDVLFSGPHEDAVINRSNDTGLVAQTFGRASGGKVILNADTITMSDGGRISTLLRGSGTGADVEVTAKNLTISGFTSQASGTPPYRLSAIDGRAYEVAATGTSGNIMVAVDNLRLENGGVIRSGLYYNAPGNAGSITVNAKTIDIASRGQIYADSFRGAGNSGNLTVNATTMNITGANNVPRPIPLDFDFTGLSTTTNSGTGGKITVALTGNLTATEGGGIKADTKGTGSGGAIDISALNVNLSGAGTAVNALSADAGNAGNVSIKTGQLNLTTGSSVTTQAQAAGAGGTVTVTADSLTLSDSGQITSSAAGAGNAGTIDITVKTGAVKLQNGGTISTSTAADGLGGTATITATSLDMITGGQITSSAGGAGNAGKINVTLTGDLNSSAGSINASTKAGGLGGSISVDAKNITLTDKGTLAASASGSGNAGDISVKTSGNVKMASGGSITTSTSDTGSGGKISVATTTLDMASASQISSSSAKSGNAGNIAVTATDSIYIRDSSLTTEALLADGGNISVKAPNTIRLDNSTLTASVNGEKETYGGNIIIDPQNVLLKGSKVVATAHKGTGGNIDITANVFLADARSLVSAASELGFPGSVNINAPNTVSGIVAPLSADYTSASALLRERCIARIKEGKYSSFVVGGRGGLPLEPGNMLPGVIQ